MPSNHLQAFPPNQALAPFKPFIGTWNTVGSHPQIPKPIHGQTSFRWDDSGGFVVIRSHVDEDVGVPRGVALIGSDDHLGTYAMIYFDSRGVSRIMHAAIEGNALRWWRSDPELSQRYRLELSSDGRTIVQTGEASRDGGVTWAKDLDQTYTKTKAP
ncbi:MAG TPA: hypothetical protein VIV58_00110 [Kofleriaceae bacterium]